MNAEESRGENPRTTRVRQIILDAALDLLVQNGAGDVTVSRIAQETGVARTTIYRHWPDQSHLVIDTIDSLVAPHTPTTISHDLEADLITALSNLRARMTRRPFREFFAALLDHANQDQTFVAAQRRFVNGVLQPLHDILTAAIGRQELSTDVDISEACAVLAGPLFHKHVMVRSTISDDLIETTVRQFLDSKHVAQSLSDLDDTERAQTP